MTILSAINATFRFYTMQGVACEATLKQIEMVSLETPHFSARGSVSRGETTKEEYAVSSWTNGNKVVAYHVNESSCSGKDIQWAQPASAKGAAAIQQPADKATYGTALSKFRELGSYAEVQGRYTKETDAQDRWDVDAKPSDAKVWTSVKNPKE